MPRSESAPAPLARDVAALPADSLPTQEQLAQHAAAWKTERAARHQRFLSGLSLRPDQQQALTSLLTAQREECLLIGLGMGAQMEKRATRWANTQTNALLKKAAEDNAALRVRADAAEKELAALKASLAGVERVVRGKIVAAAHADYPALPRLKPGTGVHYRYLSHSKQIARIARRIEEFIAGPECRGSCARERLDRELLPEVPATAYQQALNHLLLSRRLAKSNSGTYRLRAGRPAPQGTTERTPHAPNRHSNDCRRVV